MLMVLQATGSSSSVSSRYTTSCRVFILQVLEHLEAGMAQRLRDNGLSNAEYTTTGTLGQIISTLDKGQPVPLGVMHSEGTVVDTLWRFFSLSLSA